MQNAAKPWLYIYCFLGWVLCFGAIVILKLYIALYCMAIQAVS